MIHFDFDQTPNPAKVAISENRTNTGGTLTVSDGTRAAMDGS
jgi:hypothetical protein